MTRFDWAEAGRSLGPSLDHVHALVVMGGDPDATADVALGIARAQAGRRRVAVGDLFGDAPPLERLLTGEDTHGLVDSFVYGVSLNRIARPVLGEPNLFVLPTGSEPPYYEELLPNPRWRRLAAGFREVGAMLILVAPAHAPCVEALVAQTEGAVLVGEVVPPQLPVAQVITSVRAPRHTPEVPPAAPPRPTPAQRRVNGARRIAIGAAAVLLVGAIGTWFALRPLSHGGRRPVEFTGDSSGRRTAQILPLTDSLGGDSTVFDSIHTGLPPGPVRPEPVNPADSASAAIFGVEMVALNTPAGAILKLQETGGAVPAATMAPVLVDGGRWYRVVGGAYADRRGADSLLAQLRASGRIDARTGQVVRLPLAFLLRGGVPADSVPLLVADFARRGIPAYALRQPDGRIHLYAGAFASADEALLLTDLFTGSGLTPTLAYRTGRSF